MRRAVFTPRKQKPRTTTRIIKDVLHGMVVVRHKDGSYTASTQQGLGARKSPALFRNWVWKRLVSRESFVDGVRPWNDIHMDPPVTETTGRFRPVTVFSVRFLLDIEPSPEPVAKNS